MTEKLARGTKIFVHRFVGVQLLAGASLEPGRSTYTNSTPSNGKDARLSFIGYKDKLVFTYQVSFCMDFSYRNTKVDEKATIG